jgi:hydroxymethylpyrimidine/phosphomethylpyrimidine kinase
MNINKGFERPICLLTIAGSDSGGGAGIQADLKTFSALGCYGMSAITAVTAQNTMGVKGIHPVPPDVVGQQIEAVFTDMGAEAVKIGMLFSKGTIDVVAAKMRQFRPPYIVLDPVAVATSGDRLIEPDAQEALVTKLIPISTILTPNLAEAEWLSGMSIRSEKDMEQAAIRIGNLGAKAILLKGGHFSGGESTDLLYETETGAIRLYPAKRIQSPNTHGTGCTLSSAIAAFLARGERLEEAIGSAKNYLTTALEAGKYCRKWKGSGPVHHFFDWW